MIKEYIYFGIAFGGILLFLFITGRFFKWLQTKASSIERNILFGNTKIAQFFKFITPKRERDILKVVIRLIRILVVLTFFIIYLPYMFSLVPQTEELSLIHILTLPTILLV